MHCVVRRGRHVDRSSLRCIVWEHALLDSANRFDYLVRINAAHSIITTVHVPILVVLLWRIDPTLATLAHYQIGYLLQHIKNYH